MRTIEVKLYSFEELNEDAKKKAINKFSDINVDYDWWESDFEDAANIGLKITEFDCYRGGIKGSFNLSANEVAANIFKEHGENCGTYKTATKFMEEWQPIFDAYMDESNEEAYESQESEDKLMELESEFLKDLLGDYLKILRDNYEYNTSEEAIIETIKANEYEFTEEGRQHY